MPVILQQGTIDLVDNNGVGHGQATYVVTDETIAVTYPDGVTVTMPNDSYDLNTSTDAITDNGNVLISGSIPAFHENAETTNLSEQSDADFAVNVYDRILAVGDTNVDVRGTPLMGAGTAIAYLEAINTYARNALDLNDVYRAILDNPGPNAINEFNENISDFDVSYLLNRFPLGLVFDPALLGQFGSNPVFHRVFEDTSAMINVTLPGHQFHGLEGTLDLGTPGGSVTDGGVVFRRAVETDAGIQIFSIGLGTGPDQGWNNTLAPLLWQVNGARVLENAAVYAFTDNPFWFMLEDTDAAVRALSIDLANGITTKAEAMALAETFPDGIFGNGIQDELLDIVAQANTCFVAGTAITLAGGSTKPVEMITLGDQVLAHDETGALVPATVTRLFENTTQELVRLEFSDGRDDLISTPGHRFLTETGDFLEIGRMLRLGGGTARVVDTDGTVLSVTGSILYYDADTAEMFEQAAQRAVASAGNLAIKYPTAEGWKTYNFEVGQQHTYIAGGVRVHNDSILDTLQEGDQLVSLSDDFTDAAVLRDVDGDGTADFVTLEGYRDPDNGVFSTQLEKVRVKYWDPANGDLAALLASVVANGPEAANNVFDPGAGNTWNDGTWGDDIEEAFFDDVLGLAGSGAQNGPNGTPPYDAVITYVDGVPVTVPDISGATDPIALLAALSGVIAVIEGLAPGQVTYTAGSGDVVEPPFQGVSGLDAIAFILGVDLGTEIIPAVTVPGPFGPIEVTPALTLGDVLDGQVGNQAQFNIVFGEGIAPADVSQVQDGDNLVMTIAAEDGSTSTLTLEGVYADGNTDEVASVVFADGTTLDLADVPETVEGDGVVTGTAAADAIDATYTDADGDQVSAAADVIVAGAGNDTMAGGAGDDSYDGGDGTDTVQLAGTRDAFVFAYDGALTVTDTDAAADGDEGTDTLTDVETVAFSDGTSVQIFQGESNLIVTGLGSDGVRDNRTVFDTDNSRTWSEYTTTYAADGVTRTDQINTYDDGRILDIDYDANGVRTSQVMTDVDNVKRWATIETTFNAEGTAPTNKVITYDDGSVLTVDIETTFAADGVTKVDRVQTYSDGRVLDIDYDANGVRTSQTWTDPANAKAWDTITATFAEDGRTKTDQINTYDDGRVLDIDYDANGLRTSQTMTDAASVKAWSTIDTTFNAEGTAPVAQVITYDDGSVITVDIDTTFAANGVTRTDRVQTYSDGRVLDIDYDANGVRTSQMWEDTANAKAWDTIVTTFAADGRTKTDQINTYDDGRVLDIDYDADGVRTMQTMTDVENAYAWSSYTQTFDENGTLIDTSYVYDIG